MESLSAASPASQFSAGVWRVASHALPPYVIAQGNARPLGALPEFMDKEIAPRLGLRLVWLPAMSAARVQHSLMDGTAELAPLLTLTEEGLRGLRFAGQASLFMDSVLALRPDHPLTRLERLGPQDLDGLHVGTAQGIVLPPDLQARPIHWYRVSATDVDRTILTRLSLGHLDAGYFSNPESPRWSALRLGLTLALRPLQVDRRALFPAFGRHVPPEAVERYGLLAAQRFADDAWPRLLATWMRRQTL